MCRGYFRAIPSVWKEPQGVKMTQVECIRSTHGNLLPDKFMLLSHDKAGCKSQKFQVRAVHELPARPLMMQHPTST